MAIRAVERLDQERVVPVLDLVVRPVVDLHLDRVPAVVDQQDRDGHLVAYHLGYLLGCNLERAVAHQNNGVPVWVTERVAEGGRDRPPDVAPLHLDLELGAGGQLELDAVEPRVARVNEQ